MARDFKAYKQFLDEQYNELLKVVSCVAERIREIGACPIGTLSELQESTTLVERPGVHPGTSNMIADLISDHESLQVQVKSMLKEFRSRKNDPVSEDILITMLKTHEEMAWKLQSHLEGRESISFQ